MPSLRRTALLLPLLCLCTSLGATALPGHALAQPGSSETKSLTFGAEAAPADVDPADPRAMLARCDGMLDACEKDAVGVPYLAAAYLALWLILLGFLIASRRGQAKLQAEVHELQARLKELGL